MDRPPTHALTRPTSSSCAPYLGDRQPRIAAVSLEEVVHPPAWTPQGERMRSILLTSSMLWVLCAVFSGGCDGDGDADGDADSDPCDGVDCSGHGDCGVFSGEPRCLCEEGMRDQLAHRSSP